MANRNFRISEYRFQFITLARLQMSESGGGWGRGDAHGAAVGIGKISPEE